MVDLKFRMKENGVPLLSHLDIERIAERILKDYKPELLEEPGPLDVELFLENYAALEVDYQDLSSDGSILGMMVFEDCGLVVYDSKNNRERKIAVRKGSILIDNSLLEESQLARGRFTLAHELSHWFLHRHKYEEDKGRSSFTQCRSMDTEFAARKQLITDNDWMEWQADYLAAALLMPRKTVYKNVLDRFTAIGIDPRQYRSGSEFGADLWADELALKLADLYKVSCTTAKIRLKNLKLIGDYTDGPTKSLAVRERLIANFVVAMTGGESRAGK